MRYLTWLARHFEELVSGTALIIMIVATAANVIARYAFRASFIGVEELVGALAVWCVFLGASACSKRGMHIGIDIFVALLPPFSKKIVRLFVILIVIIATAYLSYLSLIFSLSAWIKRTQVLDIRYTYIDIAAFIGFGLMTVHAVRQFVRTVRGMDEDVGRDGEELRQQSQRQPLVSHHSSAAAVE